MDVTPLPPTTPGDQPPAFQLPRERLEAAPEVHRQPPASPAPRQHDAAIPATIHLGAALIHTYLRFTVADDGRIQARIVNSDTNEVVREIRPKKSSTSTSSCASTRSTRSGSGLLSP